ncbi:RagB/SusD family nutrient uptake outer membrane protein [Flavivirga jejuensis]|uniref:RagB/SusD family nutrient uptake outer membrane protein n=1 Tax=Flavivirga jejuensis TaxID=870487 RepID=A0ABT8WV59_9FLAO|nr:RagB/SusD family nutrient uptake outer membrane protein [Flavivirga jejuensis]MDO5977068.1 RagB/SusD family nutrient uptake outer membrane protein [Flavivirga jejuensis]
MKSVLFEKALLINGFTNINGLVKYLGLFVVITALTSCDDFVDIELPKDQLIKEAVFDDLGTATAAVRDLYLRATRSGIPAVDMGLYADELNQFSSEQSFFHDHSIIASNLIVNSLWGGYYNTVFATNAVIEGVESSSGLSPEDKTQLKGEALFIRAYAHNTLVQLFGAIPYIRTTDHIANNRVSRMSVDIVYDHIIEDLKEALVLLGEDVSTLGEKRIRVYDATVQAFLARVYLYTDQWEDAKNMASKVIDQFVLEPDVSKVFLKNASGTIWQFKPSEVGGNNGQASAFIFKDFPGFKPYLSTSVVNAFESIDDLRYINWVKRTTLGFHYAYKYKEPIATPPESVEYLIAFRLAEQYLIRAEARAKLGEIPEAQADLNVIRNRAGLGNTGASTTDALVDAILKERFVELFTEWGHRWVDLKRREKATEVLAPIKPGWRDTDILFPIPESQILLNPNLLPQNDGY